MLQYTQLEGTPLMESLTALEDAILRTLLYADIFDFPLTEAELHHFLIGCAADLPTLRAVLRSSARLARYMEYCDGFWSLRGRTATIAVRRHREAASQLLLPSAHFYGKLLAHLPFVRMVALTGALAVRGAYHKHDDIDFLLVTAPNRVWLARLLSIGVVRLARLRGVRLCPNYVLAETALAQAQRDIYVAHELAQMIPLAGAALYAAMRAENAWTRAFLPNAEQPLYCSADSAPRGLGRALQRLAEAALRGKLGDWLERWERRRKQRKLAAQQAAQGAAQLDAERVKGHFQDHGERIRAAYARKLSAYALTAF
jgi:hypothetical protein